MQKKLSKLMPNLNLCKNASNSNTRVAAKSKSPTPMFDKKEKEQNVSHEIDYIVNLDISRSRVGLE